jgi:hypothetical protein
LNQELFRICGQLVIQYRVVTAEIDNAIIEIISPVLKKAITNGWVFIVGILSLLI